MKFWLPYTRGGSGSDVSTMFLANGLRTAGHEAIAQPFPHALQYFPWLLRTRRPPYGTQVIITNTWNGFAFHKPGTVNISVERLFVLDPAYRNYRSFSQAVFHQTAIQYFVRRSLATADASVTVSRYTSDAMATRLGIQPPRVILNAVDTDFFRPAEYDQRLLDRENRPFRLLFIGNFTRRKGADIITKIMKSLGPGYELWFTSGMREESPSSNSDNMRCLGRLSLEEVRNAYQNADALLFPSRLEGLPRAVMEALSCGTPVIAADTSSLPEAVDDGVNGLLCPVDDVSAFLRAIRKLASDEASWKHMAHEARNAAENRFSLHRMILEYVELCEALVSRRQTEKVHQA
jgi:glycosyltransferase involved in cell wall biosynthesis